MSEGITADELRRRAVLLRKGNQFEDMTEGRASTPPPAPLGPIAREFHAAVCGACGGQAVVPFAPRNDRPVYCSSCFDKVRDGTLNVSASV